MAPKSTSAAAAWSWSSFRFATRAIPWCLRLNSRRKTLSVSLSQNDRITTPDYYRVTLNATQAVILDLLARNTWTVAVRRPCDTTPQLDRVVATGVSAIGLNPHGAVYFIDGLGGGRGSGGMLLRVGFASKLWSTIEVNASRSWFEQMTGASGFLCEKSGSASTRLVTNASHQALKRD